MLGIAAPGAMILLSGCQGILGGIYDEAEMPDAATVEGRLYIDASDWEAWHYIDLAALADSTAANPQFNTSSLWTTIPVPTDYEGTESVNVMPAPGSAGIYTYWFDVFGHGVSVSEFREFTPARAQPEPERWTIAVHRNNFRTNGCLVAETDYGSIGELPTGGDWLDNLQYESDEWTDNEVWTVQDRMLLGLIGCQGISVNRVLSRCLQMVIPPMPPLFVLDSHVFNIRLPDATYAAFQLADYMDASGTKCRFRINYKYPV